VIAVAVALLVGFLVGVWFARFAVGSAKIEATDRELFNGHPPGAAQPFAEFGEWVRRG